MSDDLRGAMEAAYTAAESSPDSDVSEVVATPEVSATSTPDPVESAPVETASQPSDTGAITADARGNIPYARHEAVLAKARQEHAWLSEHGDTQTVQQKLAILRRAEQDPAGFMRDFAAAARLNPHELFGTPPAPTPPPVVEERPAPDVPLENGQWVYSDAQTHKLLQWQQDQMLQRVNADLQPLKQKAAMADMQERATTTAQQELSAAAQWPGFSDAKSDMAQYLRDNPRATLRDAYISVVPGRLAEQAKAAETKGYEKALSEFHTKAGAASIPAPRTSGATGATAPSSVREALEQAWRD